MKHAIGLTCSLLAAGAAVVLLLLALDVRRVEHRTAAGDASVLAQPERTDLWSAQQVVPFGAARRLLVRGNDLAYRQAFRTFLLSRPWLNSALSPVDVNAARSEAEIEFAQLSQTDANPVRRSRELNMLGILNLSGGTPGDPQYRPADLGRASLAFREAIASSDGNDNAKFNLEVVLRLIAQQPVTSRNLRGLGGVATQNSQFGNGY